VDFNPLSLVFGAVVGISLGLTGGGGAIFAVPLLVYGLSEDPHEAVGVSLVAVGVTAFVGFLGRLRQGQVETPTGLLFAVAGMAGAPVGAWLGGWLSDAVLLVAFACVMLVVAVRMWRKAAGPDGGACVPVGEADLDRGPSCRRDPEGKLRWTSRCAVLLVLVGLATGLLSGLFGVGGGFVIVPALVTFTGMGIRRAIGTSLLAITLVSASAFVSQVLAGRAVPWGVAAAFAVGGAAGVFVGQWVAHRLSGPALQKTFSVAILLVAAFVVTKTLIT
jgi:uncharacterized membrane protein YfcA